MRSLPLIILCSFFLHGRCLCAGREIQLHFQPQIRQLPVMADSMYILGGSGDTVRIETCKWYVSGLQFLSGGKVVWQEAMGFHLVDALDPVKRSVSIEMPGALSYDQIRFSLGIDSLTNVSGAMGGDLDPVNGMYWTWQSGYINFKIEGTSNASPARKHEFQFHLGGYLSPYAAIQTITLDVLPASAYTIGLDLDQWLSGISMNTQHHIMSPSAGAVKLSNQLGHLFQIVQP